MNYGLQTCIFLTEHARQRTALQGFQRMPQASSALSDLNPTLVGMKRAPRTWIIHCFTRCLSLEGRMVKGKDPQRNRKMLLENWGNGLEGKVLDVKA